MSDISARGPLRFRPINACIYCGESGSASDLSDEHIIPLSLNGRAILPKASCRRCAVVTANLEGRLARGVFQPIRTLQKFKTRRPKERLSTLPLYEVDRHGNTAKTPTQISLDLHPALHILPAFDPPGMLKGDEVSNEFRNVRLHTWMPNDLNSRMDKLKASGLKKSVANQFRLGDFVRLLAKIAHGAAVADYGLGSFNPFLAKLILGESEGCAPFVGGTGLPPSPPDSAAHTVSTVLLVKRGRTLVVVNIRLFAYLAPPAPEYCVVAGEFSPTALVMK